MLCACCHISGFFPQYGVLRLVDFKIYVTRLDVHHSILHHSILFWISSPFYILLDNFTMLCLSSAFLGAFVVSTNVSTDIFHFICTVFSICILCISPQFMLDRIFLGSAGANCHRGLRRNHLSYQRGENLLPTVTSYLFLK